MLQTNTLPRTQVTRHDSQAFLPTQAAGTSGSINPLTLASLDMGLFRALRKLGTSRDRICSALCISTADFDYIDKLA